MRRFCAFTRAVSIVPCLLLQGYVLGLQSMRPRNARNSHFEASIYVIPDGDERY